MRSLAKTIRWPLLLVAVLALGFGVAGLSPSVAQAICYESSCDRPEPEENPPPKPPATTRITGVSPSFGWAGDSVTLTGTELAGATVTFNGVPATIVSATATRLVVIVPTIPATAGPMTIPVVASSSKGTASIGFTLSPTLQVSASTTFGVNAAFGQGADGWAAATASVDRSSGFTMSTLTVHSDDFLLSLVVNMSTVLLDGNGTVVAFTKPLTVESSGALYAWPSGNTTNSNSFPQALNPTTTANVRSAVIVLTRDAEAELLDTLDNAVATGQSIYDVLSTLAIV